MHHKVRTINIPTTSVPFKQTHTQKTNMGKKKHEYF